MDPALDLESLGWSSSDAFEAQPLRIKSQASASAAFSGSRSL